MINTYHYSPPVFIYPHQYNIISPPVFIYPHQYNITVFIYPHQYNILVKCSYSID